MSLLPHLLSRFHPKADVASVSKCKQHSVKRNTDDLKKKKVNVYGPSIPAALINVLYKHYCKVCIHLLVWMYPNQ